MRKIIFGIRQSILARTQLNEFISYLVRQGIDMEFEIKRIKTKGDKDRHSPIEELEQGVFIKELERELLAGGIDCAVHSLKDVPVEIANGTVLPCFPPRADERDCLVCGDHTASNRLKGLRVASGSPRRSAFLGEFEPDVKILPLRGNVDTRLKKLENGEFDAMVIAASGLKRIGYEEKISLYFDSDTFVPAAGQGVLCAQTREYDTELNSKLRDVSCRDTELAIESERRVLKELRVGCRLPFGVFARFVDDIFVITAKLYIKEKDSYISCKLKGPRKDTQKMTGDVISKIKEAIGNCPLK